MVVTPVPCLKAAASLELQHFRCAGWNELSRGVDQEVNAATPHGKGRQQQEQTGPEPRQEATERDLMLSGDAAVALRVFRNHGLGINLLIPLCRKTVARPTVTMAYSG